MNIYVRYFDYETVTHSLDELIDFLASLNEIAVDTELVEELSAYINSDIPYPKRCKVRPRVYFILIKTTANNLEEFKANRKGDGTDTSAAAYYQHDVSSRKEGRMQLIQEPNEGWYLGRLNFKRVLLIPGTTKFQYRDTIFSAYVKAESAQHCYNRIVEHLKNRQDVDPRSQFPSVKGSNFNYEFLGETLS